MIILKKNVFLDETLLFIKKYFTGHVGEGSKSKSIIFLQLCFHSSAGGQYFRTSFVRLPKCSAGGNVRDRSVVKAEASSREERTAECVPI